MDEMFFSNSSKRNIARKKNKCKNLNIFFFYSFHAEHFNAINWIIELKKNCLTSNNEHTQHNFILNLNDIFRQMLIEMENRFVWFICLLFPCI